MEVIKTRAYLLSVLLMAIVMTLFASPVQAHETCCCEPVPAQASCCCCEDEPAQEATLSSCSMSCEQPARPDIGFLIQVPPGFLPSVPAVSVELPRPPKKPAPPKSLVSSAIEEWAPPPSPPVASLNINLPPPRSLLL